MTTTQDTADRIAEELFQGLQIWEHAMGLSLLTTIIRKHTAPLEDALRVYAECGDGCTCGDGWSHGPAREALKKC